MQSFSLFVSLLSVHLFAQSILLFVTQPLSLHALVILHHNTITFIDKSTTKNYSFLLQTNA